MAAVAKLAEAGQGGPVLRDTVQHMSDEMKADEEIVIAAIRCQLKIVPEHKGNEVELKKYALKHVPGKMLQNSRVREAAGI